MTRSVWKGLCTSEFVKKVDKLKDISTKNP